MSKYIFNVLAKDGFQIRQKLSFEIHDEQGNIVDLADILEGMRTDISGKVNIRQTSDNANLILATNSDGDVCCKEGVIMQSDEREKLAKLTSTMILKGVKASEYDVEQTENPEIGWVFFVPASNGLSYNQYCYCEYEGRLGWQMIGVTSLSSQSYTNNNPTTIAVGGIEKGAIFNNFTFEDLCQNLFYPYIKLSGFSLSTNISGIHETGEPLTITKITPKFTLGSNKLVSFDVYTNKDKKTPLGSNTNGAAISGLNYKDNTIYAELSDGKTKLTATYTPTFRYPYFHGVMASGQLPTNQEIINANKQILEYGTRTFSVELTSGKPYCFFAIPDAAGCPTSIKDSNGYEYFNGANPDFELVAVSVDLLYVANVRYNIFIKKTNSYGNYKYTLSK